MALLRKSPSRNVSHVPARDGKAMMVVPRSRVRILGLAVVLGGVAWTLLWQIALRHRLSSDDEEDLRFMQLHRDPCPAPDMQFPALRIISATLKAMSWSKSANRWQTEMDACKCTPGPALRPAQDEAQGVFDVLHHGAVGDGATDASTAFSRAFAAACAFSKSSGRVGTVLVPATCFYITALNFVGPCGKGLRFKVDGTILGPLEPSSYPAPEFTSSFFPYTNGLLTFRDFRGLTVEGSGVVEGQGFVFWNRFRDKTLDLPIRPFALRLMRCQGTTISGITLRNSPMYHVFAYDCVGLTVTGVSTHSPGNSPNTDSLKMVGIQDCLISNCRFHGGDDDVSIVAVEHLIARNVTIQNVRATSGHGISIGSVGWNGTVACVSDVLVRNVTLKDLTHGVRIKSWRGGRGIVRNIRYENIQFQDTGRAIALNQSYCDKHQEWSCGDQPNSVAFYNISYVNLTGTVSPKKRNRAGIQMQCSATVPCTHITLDVVHLTQAQTNTMALLGPALLEPTFENVLESTAQGLGGHLPGSWSGDGHVSPAQAREIRAMAAECGMHDVSWESEAESSREGGKQPRRPHLAELFGW